MPVRFQKPLDVARPDEALAPRPAELRAPEVTAARADFQTRKRADGFTEGGAVPPAGALEAHVPTHGKVSLGILDPAWGRSFAAWAKPHRSDRLLELGFSSSAAHAFVDLGAQVVRLHAEPPNTPADVQALFAARLDPNQPLSAQGARAGSFDVATVNAGTSRVTPKEVAAALAPGGRLGVRGEAHLDAWQAALGELGFRTERHATVGGEAWLSGQKAGEPLRLPARVDRGSSVDRARVAELAASAPFRGPVGKATVDDAQAAPGLAAFRAAFEAQAARGAIDLTQLPFTTSVPRSATAGAPGSDALVVLAHPDDESLYTGATLAQLGLEGRDVRLAVATDGGGGRGKSAQLDATRKTELQDAARILGLSQVHPLGFPDTGKYADAQRTTPFTANDTLKAWGTVPLVESLVREIRTQRPRQVLGFDSTRDPNYSLHGHHLALGAATAIAVELAADPNAFPEQLAAGLRPWAVEAQWATVPPEVAGAASVEGAPGLKLAALDAHGSQRFSLSLPTDRLRDGEPESLQEHWHLVQSRAPAAELGSPLTLAPADPRRAAPGPRDALVERLPLEPKGPGKWLLDGDPRAQAFYGTQSASAVAKALGERNFPRAELAGLLREQNERFGAGPKALENIEKLRDPGTVAVVTGQQVGLGGGPLYALNKALGAVNYASELSREGVRAVPVFWMASYDHDLAEVGQLRWMGDSSSLEAWKAKVGDDKRAVGARPLGPEGAQAAQKLIAHYAEALGPEAAGRLTQMFQPDKTYAESFGELFAWLTHDSGLVLLDPSERGFAKLAAPLVERELFGETPSGAAIQASNERLKQAGLAPTVDEAEQPGQLNVFWRDDAGRRVHLSRAEDGGFRTTGTPATLTAAQVRAQLAAEPERFTPSALLRPAWEDTVLPTLAYVGGPSELDYYAQVGGVYDWAHLQRPQVVARPSLTLGNAKALREVARESGVWAMGARAQTVDRAALARSAFPPEVLDAYAAFSAAEGRLNALSKRVTSEKPSAEAFASYAAEASSVARELEGQFAAARDALGRVDEATRDRLSKGLQFAEKAARQSLEGWVQQLAKLPVTGAVTPPSGPLGSAAKQLQGLDSQLVKTGQGARRPWFAELFQSAPDGKPQERVMTVLEAVGKYGRGLASQMEPDAKVTVPPAARSEH